MDAIHEHEVELTAYAMEKLDEIGARVYGPRNAKERAGVVSFTLPDVHPHDMATIVDQEGVCDPGRASLRAAVDA